MEMEQKSFPQIFFLNKFEIFIFAFGDFAFLHTFLHILSKEMFWIVF